MVNTIVVDWLVPLYSSEVDIGAWDKVDEQLTPAVGSSKEFDDDYDPDAEADTVGKAFGDYNKGTGKKSKQRNAEEPAPRAFDDKYEPEVDATDPLAGAFGDGFRTSKPAEVGSYASSKSSSLLCTEYRETIIAEER